LTDLNLKLLHKFTEKLYDVQTGQNYNHFSDNQIEMFKYVSVRIKHNEHVYDKFDYVGLNFFVYITSGSRDSSVGIATGYGLDDQEGRDFESR
jgi:hypothetical protein